jgi:hypothetical protein
METRDQNTRNQFSETFPCFANQLFNEALENGDFSTYMAQQPNQPIRNALRRGWNNITGQYTGSAAGGRQRK